MTDIEGGLRETFREWMRKVESGLLPPDPARTVKAILDVPVEIEHVVPVPPLLEKVHSEVTVNLIEKLPRLPMTGEFPYKEWKFYKRERW